MAAPRRPQDMECFWWALCLYCEIDPDMRSVYKTHRIMQRRRRDGAKVYKVPVLNTLLNWSKGGHEVPGHPELQYPWRDLGILFDNECFDPEKRLYAEDKDMLLKKKRKRDIKPGDINVKRLVQGLHDRGLLLKLLNRSQRHAVMVELQQEFNSADEKSG